MAENDRAPVDFFIKMHGALVSKNYELALNYCNEILSYEYEKKNEIMNQFHELLTKKLDIMDEETDSSDTSSLSNSSDGNTDVDII